MNDLDSIPIYSRELDMMIIRTKHEDVKNNLIAEHKADLVQSYEKVFIPLLSEKCNPLSPEKWWILSVRGWDYEKYEVYMEKRKGVRESGISIDI